MIVPRVKQFRAGTFPFSQPIVSPRLLNKVQQQRAISEETRIDVLGVADSDLKRLGEADIFTLKQLVYLHDTDILTIPHFGIIKVRRLKAKLKSYLTTLLDPQNQESKQLSGNKNTEVSLEESNKTAVPLSSKATPKELEDISKSLDKLERRLLSLESEFMKAKIIK